MVVYGFTMNEFIKEIPKSEINNAKTLVNERLALRRDIKSIEHRLDKITKELKLMFKKKNPEEYEIFEKDNQDPLVLMGR